MDKNIRQILDELYVLDNSLRDRENDLIKVIEKFNALKINFEPDSDFKTRLLNEIRSQTQVQQNFNHSLSLTFMNKIYYSIGGSVLVIAIMIGYNNLDISGLLGQNPMKVSIKNVDEKAFGALSGIDSTVSNLAPESGRGGGGGVGGAPAIDTAMMRSSRPQSGGGSSAGSTGIGNVDSKMMYPYEFKQYVYKYTGSPLEMTDEKVNVLQRITGPDLARQFSKLIGQIKFSGINLKAFDNLVIQNIAVAEDKEFGHAINLSPMDGSINIYENWPRWTGTGAYPQCQDEACWNNSRLKPSDIPSDQEMIRIAKEFVNQKGLDLSGYGEPFVQNDWKTFPVEPLSSELYAPDIGQVIFPLQINGKKVYEGSSPVGVYVAINARVNKVSSVSGIFINNYNSSAYETEKDVNRILEKAKWGGMYGYAYRMEGATVVELELDTPTLEYVKVYKSDPNTGVGTELLSPAWVFPIKNTPSDGYFYQRIIVVPIVKDLLEDSSGGPIIMPMEKAL